MQPRTARLITACVVVITTLMTLTVAFSAVLTIVSILDAPEDEDLGFVFMIGSLNGQHAAVAFFSAIGITFLIWIGIILGAGRPDAPQIPTPK